MIQLCLSSNQILKIIISINSALMGAILRFCRGEPEPVVIPEKKSKVTQTDVVKSKLKKSRDFIQNFIDKKQQQIDELQQKILEKYEKNKNKKQLLPLLQTKKELKDFVQQSETRIRVINKTIRDIQMQQTDLESIKVLEQTNQFQKKIQDQMENMGWRDILADAQQKYEGPQWEKQEQSQDVKQLWKQLGGDKMDQLESKPLLPVEINIPKVAVVEEIHDEQDQKQEQKQVQFAQ